MQGPKQFFVQRVVSNDLDFGSLDAIKGMLQRELAQHVNTFLQDGRAWVVQYLPVRRVPTTDPVRYWQNCTTYEARAILTPAAIQRIGYEPVRMIEAPPLDAVPIRWTQDDRLAYYDPRAGVPLIDPEDARPHEEIAAARLDQLAQGREYVFLKDRAFQRTRAGGWKRVW